MKQRIISFALALLLTFSLGACAAEKPSPAETSPTPTEASSPEPETNLTRWLGRAEDRYNMRYGDFNDYWCLLCDEYFGEDMHILLDTISACKNANYDLESNNAQISEKRAEYKKRGGKNWSFEITKHSEKKLGEQACKNFSDELKSVHDLICAVTDKAQGWSEYDWEDFAQSMGCEVEDVKKIIDSYSAIAEACDEVDVTSALAIELTVTFSDGDSVTDRTTLYEIGGEYVSTELIDAASMLIQLIYF